ncbi:LysR family transcriptional regulator [Kiloniella laminariae]|uniref:LysR family transcriptional regulator n=1 Tax=Kiloniella laminariae TaxID=454162 RepID=A0ABT4LJZ9_9PROT|nr:LysR family transcriptional regulator [Kiloniella laminariae]MCZ4281434.1 LysR family transcriptional regulator [Kiloniella laminariae]
MDIISDMTVFVEVVEAGGMTAAGRNLNLSAAVVSKRIANLEERLDVRLLNRTTRRLSLTDEGAGYFARCKVILEDIADAEAALSGVTGHVKGTLRITAPASFGRKHISSLLPEFLKLHPEVAIQISLSDQIVDMVHHGFDLAIRTGELQDSSLIARKLSPARRVVCASPDYLAQAGVPGHPKDLEKHNCLVLGYPGGVHDHWHFKSAEGEISVKVRGTLETNNGEILRDAAKEGIGIAIKSTWDIAEELKAGLLIPILTNYELPSAAVYVLYPNRQHLPAKSRAFIDFLESKFGSEPYWDEGISLA